MKRVFLFLAINLAIVLVLSVSIRLLGMEPYLNAQGPDLSALLIFTSVFSFGGAFISLAPLKVDSKKLVGAVVIVNPRTTSEQWLGSTCGTSIESCKDQHARNCDLEFS